MVGPAARRSGGRLRSGTSTGGPLCQGLAACLAWHDQAMSATSAQAPKQGLVDKWTQPLLAGVLIAVLVICAILLAAKDVPRFWVVTLQVASAVSGAWLGSIIQSDRMTLAARTHARLSVRHLFDHMRSIGRTLEVIEAYRADVDSKQGSRIGAERVSEWLDRIEGQLRGSLESAATAVENWNDQAPGISAEEVANYRTRAQRLSTESTVGEEQS